jgi:ribosomal protein L37E
MQPQMLRCPRCGAPFLMGQTFCSNCGLPAPRNCPRCGSIVNPQAAFCNNCGLPISRQGPQPSARQDKPRSGRSRFGDILFGLGVLCAIAVPVIIVLNPETESSKTYMIMGFAAGGFLMLIGLILMRSK